MVAIEESGMMFPKAKRIKGHKTNPPPPPGTKCYFCPAEATETHELAGGSNRNRSIELGFQLYLCYHCHNHWHLFMTRKQKDAIRATEQQRVMDKYKITLDRWRMLFGKKSWL